MVYMEFVCCWPLHMCASAWAGLLLTQRHYGSRGGPAELREIMSFSSGLHSLKTRPPHLSILLFLKLHLSLSLYPHILSSQSVNAHYS